MAELEIQISIRIDRLRQAREQMGWSQRELARRCGIGEVQVNRYEAGQGDPSTANLKLIAETLCLSVDYLLGLTDEPRGHLGDGELNQDERTIVDTFRRAGWPGVARLMADAMEK